MRKVGTHPEPPRHIFSHLSHIPTAMIRGLLHKKLLAAASRLARVLFSSPLTSPPASALVCGIIVNDGRMALLLKIYLYVE